MKIVKAFEYSNVLIKGVTKTTEHETKKKRGRFLGMLLGTLGASLLGSMLAGEAIVRAGYGYTGKALARAGYGSKIYF